MKDYADGVWLVVRLPSTRRSHEQVIGYGRTQTRAMDCWLRVRYGSLPHRKRDRDKLWKQERQHGVRLRKAIVSWDGADD